MSKLKVRLDLMKQLMLNPYVHHYLATLGVLTEDLTPSTIAQNFSLIFLIFSNIIGRQLGQSMLSRQCFLHYTPYLRLVPRLM
jgi:hypothetical protein